MNEILNWMEEIGGQVNRLEVWTLLVVVLVVGVIVSLLCAWSWIRFLRRRLEVMQEELTSHKWKTGETFAEVEGGMAEARDRIRDCLRIALMIGKEAKVLDAGLVDRSLESLNVVDNEERKKEGRDGTAVSD